MPASGQNCRWVQDRMDSYVDGELHGSELSEFEQHADACGSCRSDLALARSVADGLRALPALQCPPRVVDEAAARVEPAPKADSLMDRLTGWFAGKTAYLPRPAMAAVVVVIVAAVVFVLLQQERFPFEDREGPQLAVTEQEAELAKLDVMLAFAYLGKYSRKTGDIISNEVIGERVLKPVGKTVVDPIYPFPREE